MNDSIDFSMLRQPVYTGGDAVLAAALEDELKRRHEAKQQEERLAVQRDMNNRLIARDKDVRTANEARQNLAERRVVGQETAANFKNRAATEESIRGDLANRDLGRAEQRASSYVEQDPSTGAPVTGLPGFRVDRGGPAPAAPIGQVEGPSTTPEILRNAAGIRAEQASFDPQADQKPDVTVASELSKADAADQPFQARDALVDAYKGKRQDWETKQKNPDVYVGGVKADPEALRYSAGRAESGDFERLGSALQNELTDAVQSGDAARQAAAQRKLQRFSELAPMVETGRVTAAKASLDVNGQTTAENLWQRGAEHDKTVGDQAQRRAETAATAAATRASTPRPASATGTANTELSRRRVFGKQVDDMAKRYDLPADLKNFNRAAMNIKAAESDNSVLQAAAQFGIARDITGGGGQSLSNKDVAFAAPRAGGLERLQALAQRQLDGTLDSPEEKKVLADAIRAMMQGAGERIQGFANDYYDTFNNDDLPWKKELGEEYLRGILRQYVPGAIRNAGQGEGKTEREAATGSGSQVPTMLQDVGNPDDPNAPDADRPFDEDPGAGEIDQIQVMRGGRPAPAARAATTPTRVRAQPVADRDSAEAAQAEINRRRREQGLPERKF